MATLTSEQANELANNFLGLSQAIGDFRYKYWNTLSTPENQKLGSLQWSILSYGEDILAFSTILVMNEAEASLKEMNQITSQIESTILKLKLVQKVIDVATAIVTLGEAILAKDTQSIGTSIDTIFDTWSEEETA